MYVKTLNIGARHLPLNSSLPLRR